MKALLQKPRLVAVLLLVLLLVLPMPLQSCTNRVPKPSAPTQTQQAALAPLSISINMTEAKKQKNDALYDFFSEKFNIELVPVPFSFGEWQQQIRVWAVSGALPDLIWLNINENTYSEYAAWARAGTFRAMPANLKTRYSNIGTLLNRPDIDAEEKLTIDEKLFAYPIVRNTESRNFLSAQGFYYRRDWAEKLGMAQNDDIYTWEQFVELGRAFVERDPGNNGPGKTVGAGTRYDFFPQAFGGFQMATVNGLGPFQKVDDHYEWTAARPETLQGILIAKQLYDEQIIWNDNALGSNHWDKYKAGLMGIVFDNFDFARVTEIRKAFKKSFLDVNPENALRPMYVRGPKGHFWMRQLFSFSGAVAFRSGLEQAKVDRTLSMFDWLLDDEGMLFRQYGFEGRDYSLKENDMICLWEKNALTGGLTDPYAQGSRQFYQLAAPDALYSPVYPHSVISEGNAVFDFNIRNAMVRRADPFSSFFDSPARDDITQLSEQTHRQMVALMTTARIEEVPELWYSWVQEMLPQVQPFLDELTAAAQNGER